jgi:RimJ/RimL family protein N-acetyltransferase
MTLETVRLVLAPWQAADWTAFRPIATDPEVMRYITGGVAWTDEQIRSFVDRQVKLYLGRGFCRWKLVEKASEELIGFCGVGFWMDSTAPEIGWWLARHWWGRGLATEAATAALGDAFGRVGLRRLISVAERENRASIRIMQKLGLTFEREFEAEGCELVQYAMERAQWAGQRRASEGCG